MTKLSDDIAVEEAETVKFTDFDAGFQEKLLAMQIRELSFASRTDGLIKPDYFESRADATLLSLALNYYSTYKRVPDDVSVFITVFKEAVLKGYIRDDLKVECVEKIRAVFKSSLTSVDYAIDAVATFARHQAIQGAMLEAFDAMERHNLDRAQEVMEKAFKVGAYTESAAYDYWNEIDSRTQERVDIKSGKIKPRGISTGIRALDKLLFHRGWGIAELTIIMAGAKKGKTFSIWDFAKKMSEQGYNVLGLTLEVSKEVISARLDASVADELIDEIGSKILTIHKAVKAASEKKVGRLFIHEMPMGTCRPIDLDNLLEHYKADGIQIDALVVDYMDIMAPNKWTANDIENSRTVWVDTRAILQKYQIVGLSATQTNREGHKSITAKAEHVAEDFNKIRIADLVISLNATEEEMAAGEARLFFAASRTQKGEFTVRIKRDLARGHALKEVLGYE